MDDELKRCEKEADDYLCMVFMRWLKMSVGEWKTQVF